MLRLVAAGILFFGIGLSLAISWGGWPSAPQINRYEGTIESIDPTSHSLTATIPSALYEEGKITVRFSYTDATQWFTLTRMTENGYEISGINTTTDASSAHVGQRIIFVATTDSTGSLILRTAWLIVIV